MRRFIVLLLALCCGISVQAQSITCTVTQVISGDTFICTPQGQAPVTLRLYQVRAPEPGQAGAQEAEQGFSRMIMGRTLTMPTYGPDSHGHLQVSAQYTSRCACEGFDYSRGCAICACVYDVGEEMVRSGWAQRVPGAAASGEVR